MIIKSAFEIIFWMIVILCDKELLKHVEHSPNQAGFPENDILKYDVECIHFAFITHLYAVYINYRYIAVNYNTI